MCGIAGFWMADDSGPANGSGRVILKSMNDALRHRGPDGEGYWQDGDSGVAMAQRRLAILDLSSTGAQPMTSASGRYVIVYNGEIYNHLDLRRELDSAGARPLWRGHSDTETLLAAIEAWGLEPALTRLCGMFAFALWDQKERELTLVRDRLGEKPLYYGWVGGTLLFGSQLKALCAFPGFQRGHSDTETLLAAIEAWGLEPALTRLCGMFAFALWDQKERELTLVRDRLGEKPLYYGWVGGTLLFGSQLKALCAFPGFQRDIDRDAVSAYLRFSYVPHPHSIYRDARKLSPGHLLRLKQPTGARSAQSQCYWSAKDVIEAGAQVRTSAAFAQCSAELEALLGDVVESQMLSDVPLGSFLSGGIDSSLITALMQARSTRPVPTFSIGFDIGRFNEADHARAVAEHLKTDHTEFVVTEADALALIPELPQIFDEPFADSSQLPTILLSRLTRKSVTVALSGDGGDEMFGGYNRYLYGPMLWRRLGGLPRSARRGIAFAAAAAQRLGTSADGRGGNLAAIVARLGLPVSAVDRLSKFGGAIGRAQDFKGFYRELVSTFPEPGDVARHSGEALCVLDSAARLPTLNNPAEAMMAMDALSYLPDDILVKVDRSAMATSLETRVPFLDVRVVEQAARLPMAMKINGRRGKHILRDILYRHVPCDLIERPKQGFAVPMDAWLRGSLRDWAESLLTKNKLEDSGLFEPQSVMKLWHGHQTGRDNAGAKLWTILVLQAAILSRD